LLQFQLSLDIFHHSSKGYIPTEELPVVEFVYQEPKNSPPEKLSYVIIHPLYIYICILLNPVKSYPIIFPLYHHDIPSISPCYINVEYYSHYIPIVFPL
jgi:hypothetical protein